MRTRFGIILDKEHINCESGRFNKKYDTVECRGENCDSCPVRFICLTTKADEVLSVKSEFVQTWMYRGRRTAMEIGYFDICDRKCPDCDHRFECFTSSDGSRYDP